MFRLYKKNLLTSLLIFSFLSLFIGCEKKIVVSDDNASVPTKVEAPVKTDDPTSVDERPKSDDGPKTNKDEPPTTPQKINPIDLSTSEEFAILAYSNITSFPKSLVDGKIGLFPGRRDLIFVEPSEVVGGGGSIYASDDESIQLKKLTSARKDMLTAYKDALSRIPDADKVSLYNGRIDQKTLLPGIYHWTSDLVVSEDFTLQGTDKDIWIFKIDQDLKVMANTHLKLIGGAKAYNIFWQVAGSANFEENILFSGTILAQQFIDMKKNCILHGRAFAKNGYVNLDRDTIVVPRLELLRENQSTIFYSLNNFVTKARL